MVSNFLFHLNGIIHPIDLVNLDPFALCNITDSLSPHHQFVDRSLRALFEPPHRPLLPHQHIQKTISSHQHLLDVGGSRGVQQRNEGHDTLHH